MRAFRTFLQVFLAVFLGSGVLSGIVTTSTVNLDLIQAAAISAGAAGLSALISFIQNWLEDSTGKKVLGIPK